MKGRQAGTAGNWRIPNQGMQNSASYSYLKPCDFTHVWVEVSKLLQEVNQAHEKCLDDFVVEEIPSTVGGVMAGSQNNFQGLVC